MVIDVTETGPSAQVQWPLMVLHGVAQRHHPPLPAICSKLPPSGSAITCEPLNVTSHSGLDSSVDNYEGLSGSVGSYLDRTASTVCFADSTQFTATNLMAAQRQQKAGKGKRAEAAVSWYNNPSL